MARTPPLIYQFTAFGLYIKAWCQAMGSSQGRLADDIEMHRGHFGECLNPERDRWFPREHIPKLARSLGLDADEQTYLTALILVESETDPAMRRALQSRMASLARFKLQLLAKTTDYSLLHRWYIPVLLEMVRWPRLPFDFETIGKRLDPPIDAGDVAEALGAMERVGWIRHEPGQGFAPLVRDLAFPGAERGAPVEAMAALKAYHREQLGLSLRALEEKGSHERLVNGLTIAVRAKSFGDLQKKLQVVIGEMLNQSELEDDMRSPEDTDCVYQLNIQLFPCAFLPPDSTQGEDA